MEMTALPRIAEPRRRGVNSAEIKKQRGAVVDALDRLFAHEIPDGRRRVELRLVWPRESALDRDPIGEGLRAFIIRRGWDLWTHGGPLELFATVRVVMAARPERQMWNRTQLAALWGDIGEHHVGRH
jgi:hypothetical protein